MANKNTRPGKSPNPKQNSDAVPRSPTMYSLDQLHLDPKNPRFGGEERKGISETDLLDSIVQTYGVKDVLSSIATNGYLEAEPLVGQLQDDGSVRVIEGNRRLAALLILANDDRAQNQTRLRAEYDAARRTEVREVPVIAYPHDAEPETLLPYLGVKHIVGPKEWDSYAKAAWIADVLKNHGEFVTIEQIEQMIGDKQNTIKRILEGYYLVAQLRDAGVYNPSNSTRRGKGSASEFPFSWVYNALGYRGVRDWLKLEGEVAPNPVPTDQIEKAGQLMTFLFGDQSKGTISSIKESRQISDLANCLGDSEKVLRLRKGMQVAEVLRWSRPVSEKLQEAFADAEDALSEAWEALGEIGSEDRPVREFEPRAKRVREQAIRVHKEILNKMSGDE